MFKEDAFLYRLDWKEVETQKSSFLENLICDLLDEMVSWPKSQNLWAQKWYKKCWWKHFNAAGHIGVPINSKV